MSLHLSKAGWLTLKRSQVIAANFVQDYCFEQKNLKNVKPLGMRQNRAIKAQ
jgi:hypothetical protein